MVYVRTKEKIGNATMYINVALEEIKFVAVVVSTQPLMPDKQVPSKNFVKEQLMKKFSINYDVFVIMNSLLCNPLIL